MADLKDSATHNMKIILFSGKAEHGKTNAARIAKERLEAAGYKVVKLAYGDHVKSTATSIHGWNGKKDGIGRGILQWWGTDVVRARDPDLWVDTVIRLCDVMRDMFDFAIVDDSRYPNEIYKWKRWRTRFHNFLRRLAKFPQRYPYEIITVRVERPGHISELTPELLAHASEVSLDNHRFDVYLTAQNLTELEEQVDNVLMPKLIDLPFKKGETA